MELEIGIELGNICKKIKKNTKEFLDKITDSRVNLLTIVEFIENQIKTNVEKTELNPVAFPVGISVNNVAAHDTCLNNDSRSFNFDTDLIKIDFGIQKDGIIIDNAFSYSRNNNLQLLIDASKRIVEKVIGNLKPGVKIIEIQKIANNTLEEFNTGYGLDFVAISNLAGHQIKPHLIHADKDQLIYPNCLVNKNTSTVIQEDSFYAIEFFVSNGTEQFPKMENSRNTHFMVNPLKLKKLTKMTVHNNFYNQIRDIIVTNFKTLPFCQRFIQELNSDFSTGEVNDALDYFFSLGILSKFPPVLDSDTNTRISQHEETVYVTTNKTITLS